MNIWILDDIYGKDLYDELQYIFPKAKFPIKNNIENPIPYLSSIQSGDIIILDNFFFYKGREQALGDDFLRQYLKLKLNCKIICISNYGEKIINRFEQRNKVFMKGDIIGFVPGKRADDIAYYILSLNTPI